MSSRSQYENEYPDSYSSHDTFTIHSLFPRGPPPLPPGKILKAAHQRLPSLGFENVELPSSEVEREDPEFTLDDFQMVAGMSYKVVNSKLHGAMISRQNYLKLTSWFATNVPTQDTLNIASVSGTLYGQDYRTSIKRWLFGWLLDKYRFL